MKVTKKKLINDVKYLFMVCAGLLGTGIAGTINNYLILPSFFIFGLIGYMFRPYDENGEYRY